MAVLTPELAKSEYEAGDSLGVIAERYQTYPNKVRRMILKAGGSLRDRSEAQTAALKSGRSEHPTEGKERPKEDKIKISEGVAKNWANISDKERKFRKEQARARWEQIPDDVKQRMQTAANEAIRIAAKEGSKLEKSLSASLSAEGYRVTPHAEFMMSAEKMHIDIFLPEVGRRGTAIEIDGPSHHWPVWGEESLAKVQEADQTKNGLLLNVGIHVIRIANLVNTVSDHQQRVLVAKLLQTLTSLENVKKADLVELEIENG
jgi:hypothetical protein